MRIPILTFGAIASILTINSVLADTTVTSKTYVDTTRQATIPATGTNASTPGTTVVTYTGTAGQIGERGIFDPETGLRRGGIVSGHENDLVTASMVVAPQNTVSYKECVEWDESVGGHYDHNCLLWDLRNAPIRARQCYSSEDCSGYGYSCGGICEDGICVNGIC
jgi:hypothetical protein